MIKSQRMNRRNALRALGAGGALSAVGTAVSPAGQEANSNQLARKLALIQAGRNEKWKGSPLGNLYPFIKKMQEEAPQSMAFLKVRPNTYDRTHKFPARAQQLMMDWFDRWV